MATEINHNTAVQRPNLNSQSQIHGPHFESVPDGLDDGEADVRSNIGAGDFVPFPTDQLPEPLRKFVKYHAEAIGCDPSFIAIPLLVACASSVGSSRMLKLKPDWFAKSILWGAVVGESGSLKTPAFAAAQKPWRDWQSDNFDRYEKEMACYIVGHEQWKVENTARKTERTPSKKP